MPKRPSDGGLNIPKQPKRKVPPGEEPGGRGGNPSLKPPIGIGNGPGHPHAVPTPHVDPYQESVDENLQYLTTQQRAEVGKRQKDLSALKAQAQAASKKLSQIVALSGKGEQGVRAQQALLRQAGYNLAVDGKYGANTEAALKDYVTKETDKWNAKLQDSAKFSHPLSLRAEANSKFTPQKINNSREFIISYASQQQQQLRQALKNAEGEVRSGKSGADDVVRSIKAALKGYDTLRAKAMDPVNGMDPTDLDRTMRNIIEKQKNDLQQANITDASREASGPALFGEAATSIESLIGQEALDLLNKATIGLFNRGSAAFAAGFETGLHTGNYAKALQAFVGGFASFIRVPMTDISLVGAIAPGGSDARKYIEATNTQSEMDALVEKGDLLSFGQTLTGRVPEKFNEKHPLGIGNPGTLATQAIRTGTGFNDDPAEMESLFKSDTVQTSGFDFLSAAADFGTQLIKDPTLIASMAVEPLNEFGNVERGVARATEEAKARFGEDGLRQLIRAVRIENTPTGRALMAKVDEVVANSFTALELDKAIHGIGPGVAEAAMAAKETDGVEAASSVIKKAFTEGVWNPHISVVRRLTNDIAERIGLIAEDGGKLEKSLLGASAGIGNKAVKMKDRLQAIRTVAEPKGPIAAAYERDAVAFVDEAVTAASTAEHSTVNALWTKVVGESTAGLDIETRFYNVMAAIYDFDNPALHAAFEGYMRGFFTNTQLLDSVPLGSYMEAVFNQDGFEQAVRKMETIAALAGGKGASGKQFAADLARGFLPDKNAAKSAFQTAAQNVGLKLGSAKKTVTRKQVMASIRELPQDDRAFFTDRLLKLRGKSGLGRLATDVELANSNPQLREELLRILEQQKGRAEQAAEGVAAKPGLARRARGVPAKLILSNADTAPPAELRFKYATANELQHAHKRAVAAERYLLAGYVPRQVRETLIRAVETVQTEEELFAVRDRIVRAVMEAKGIEHPDMMMALLDARGSLKQVATKPMRTVFQGEGIDDLQVLAQRVEQVRLPRPAELAANYRQAIVDGAESASASRRMTANLRVNVLDRVGTIQLHFTHLDGRVATVSSSFQAVHRAWKFLIVTNAGLPIIGATAGFVGTKGSLGDRLHNAGLGFAFGSLGGIRYVTRIAGIEERSRMLLNDGFTADIHIPGWAKLKARRYALEDPTRRTLSYELVRTGRLGQGEFDNELLTHIDPDWVVLDAKKHSRAVDAWHRIINHQIHPESDPVMQILLHEQAGHLEGTEEVTRVVRVAESAPEDLVKSVKGAAEDARTPFQREMDAIAAEVESNGIGRTTADNEDLLSDFAGRDTKTLWRGEDGEYANHGAAWIPESYNKGRGEQYARNFAGEEGHVYKIELPVGEDGVPLVGRIAEEGNLGWMLDGEDAKWADAATEAAPPGMAGTAADKVSYKTVTKTIEVTGKESADRQIAAFLDTEEGELWAARWRGAKGGASPKQAVKRMREFLERYSTPELANLRVAGGVNGVAGEVRHDTLKRLIKAGIGPDEFHAQQTWKMPRNAKELFHVGARIENKFVLAGPSNFLNRGPYFRSLFEKEYERLLMNGVEHKEAQEVADVVAERHLNHVLDRMDDPSRFAHGIDPFLPFQQAREDTVRAYGSIIAAHPINTLRLQSYAAKLFNDGKNQGIFVKNEFTGQWQMAVPGSGRLARTLFKLPLETNWTFNLNDLLFVGNGAYGIGLVPTLGGPFWGAAANLLATAKPDLFTGNNPIQDWLWSYGKGGQLLRADNSRLWMAFTGDVPPWERLTQDNWRNEHNRWQTEVAQQLIYEHRKKNPADLDWFPTQEIVDDATKKFYETWAFIGSTFPASSYPTLTGKDKYWSARNAFTVGGILDWDPEAFLAKYPEFVPFTVGPDAKYIGPDDADSLKQFNVGAYNPLSTFNEKTGEWETSGGAPRESTQTEKALGYRQYRSFLQFKDDFKFYKRQGEFFNKLEDARALQKLSPLEGERALSTLNKDYADVVQKGRRTYDIKTDLYNINWKYPKQLRAGAIARVKAQYGLSGSDLNYFMTAAQDPDFMPNAWREARLGSDVENDVRLRFGGTVSSGLSVDTAYEAALANGSVEKYVATLNPAEQANFWKYQGAALGYDPNLDSPNKVLDKYNYFKKHLSAVYKEYPWLFNSDKNFSQGVRTTIDPKTGKRTDVLTGKPYENPFEVAINKIQTNLSSTVNATYTSIDKVGAEMQAAAQAKNWKAYYALKDQQSRLYDVAEAISNRLRGKLPDLTKYYDDMHAAALEGAAGNAKEQEHYLHQAAMDKANAPYFLISDQRRFLNYPPAIQRAYSATLVQGLDMPTGKNDYDVMQYIKETTGLKKLFWEYLSPTQQDILEKNFPQFVDKWKYQSDFALHGPGSKDKSKKQIIPTELQWAYNQLESYNKRSGEPTPTSYNEYLKLPANLAVREQYLKAHPDLREYMNGSAFAHMPETVRDSVKSILTKYGNYNKNSGSGGGTGYQSTAGTGGGYSSGTHIKDRGLGYEGNVNVAWAHEQLYIWSRRKDATKPSNYDAWVDMPTGEAKAAYLNSHPELQAWIKLGPMANMPEEYKSMVRDIMYRYNEWTQKDDPLGNTITKFFATPGYARQDFLAEHPELEAYWAVSRTEAEQADFDLRNQYFEIQDVGARRAFLQMHPELQQSFIDARTKRYEAFLNQTAVYMGQNPEMFTAYLDRQTDIMAELLRKFAEPVLIREVGPTYVSASAGTGSRQRQPQTA